MQAVSDIGRRRKEKDKEKRRKTKEIDAVKDIQVVNKGGGKVECNKKDANREERLNARHTQHTPDFRKQQ